MKDICANNHGGNAESVEAFTETTAHKNKAMILRYLEKSDATCEEMEWVTGLSHQTCSARFSELKRDGLIEPTERRKTQSGRYAMAWRKVEK